MAPLLKRHHVNVGIYLGVSVLSKAASVLLIPLYTKRLTPREYGSYGICQTLLWLLPPLLSLALTSAFSRFYFDDSAPDARRRTLGQVAAGLALCTLTAAVMAEVLIDLTHALAPRILPSAITARQLRLVLWASACVPIAELPMLYYRAGEQALRYAAYQLALFALTVGTTVLLMTRFALGVDGLLGGILAGQVAGACVSLLLMRRNLLLSLDTAALRRALAFSLPFIPHMIGNTLMVGTDRWVLERFGLREDLGLYTLAVQLTLPITLATVAWNEATSPRYFAVYRDGGVTAARRALPRLVLGFVGLGGTALVALIVARPLLRLLVGPRFADAFLLVPWVGLTVLTGAIYSAFVNVLQLKKTTRVIPVLTLSSVAVNVALNWILVPRLKVYGAIVGTGLAYAFRNLILWRFALLSLREDQVSQPGLTGDSAS